jgi:hypothetical protein
MAAIVKTEKGFKIIKVTRDEILNIINSAGLCDGCSTNKCQEGFYIAALNRWYCPDCYNSWYNRAEYYPEEAMYEERNYTNMYNVLIARAN